MHILVATQRNDLLSAVSGKDRRPGGEIRIAIGRKDPVNFLCPAQALTAILKSMTCDGFQSGQSDEEFSGPKASGRADTLQEAINNKWVGVPDARCSSSSRAFKSCTLIYPPRLALEISPRQKSREDRRN